MAELEEKLGAILNNPQAMGQIMALAQSLGGNSEQNPKKQAVPAVSSPVSATSEPFSASPSPLPVLDASEEGDRDGFVPVTFEETGEEGVSQPLSGLNLDPRLLSIGMKALSAYQDPNDSKALLLQALRPFVKEERFGKVDKAVKIARISRSIRAVLDGLKGGEGDV